MGALCPRNMPVGLLKHTNARLLIDSEFYLTLLRLVANVVNTK